MKKTSVEFLIKEFSDIIGPLDTKPMQDLLMMDAMKRAKAMEKDQLKETAIHFFPTSLKKEHFEHYYNETYGK